MLKIGWRLLRTIWRLTLWTIWLLARLTLLIAPRLVPFIWRRCAAVTGELLAIVDQPLGGRISRRRTVTLLLAGGLWLLLGLLVNGLWDLLWVMRPFTANIPLLAGSFLFGLACGYRARRAPDWGTWAVEDGLQLGENR